MEKSILITFLMSLLVFLLTFWTAGYSLYAACLAESVAFFVLTYYVLKTYAKPGTFGLPFVVAVVAGRIVLDVPLRVMEFPETLFSLFVPIVVIVSIVLAALYYKENRVSVLVLSVFIILLLATVGQAEWLDTFHYKR